MDEAETKLFNEMKVAREAAETALKTAIKPEEHQKLVDEHKKLTDEVGGLRSKAQADQKAAEDIAKAKAETDKVAKDKILADKRTALVKAGLPEDKVKNLSEEGLSIAEMTMAVRKPGADMGGGSGGSSLTGSPYELAKLAYTK
mgnify:CR=1 FL=1